MAFSVGALTDYVDQHSMELIGELYYNGDSLKFFQKQPGTVGTVAINYFDIDIYMNKGFCAAITDPSATTFAQKNITVCDYKVEGSWCVNVLQKKYFAEQIKGVIGDSVQPFEAVLLNQLKKRVLEQLEVEVWKGTDGTADCLGLYYQLTGDSARVTVSGSTTITVNNIYSILELMLQNIPTVLLGRDDLYLFIDPALYTLFMQATASANNFAVPIVKDDNGDIVIDWLGPKITMHRTFGLAGTGEMMITPLINLYHAFDGTNDEEKVELWYERKDDKLWYRIKFRSGWTYWLADYVVATF